MSAGNPLNELIRSEIEAAGPVTFARFMERALYEPGLGYYERPETPIGRGGDFYTSASVGPLFGRLLAFQMTAWAVAQPEPFQIVEAGAHDGRLAADILGWVARQRPELLARMEYWIAEPSSRRAAWQRRALKEFLPWVRWAAALSEVPPAGFRIIFCNELLDAFPVSRFGWDTRAGRWFEWGVTWDQDHFAWVRLPPNPGCNSDPQTPEAIALLPAEIRRVLPEDYTVEISPAALRWWDAAARSLGHGRLLALDYGLTAEELFRPERRRGTLRAFRSHRQARDLLAEPGLQDLTADVNFSAVIRTGEAAGLATGPFTSQERFLTEVASRAWSEPDRFGAWTREDTRQLQTLTHPEHLGRAFRVLVQSTR